MKTVLRLAWAHAREHPLRIVLTSLATAAAAAMVIWVVSGYDSLLRTFDEYANLALGRYELSVAPITHFSQVAPGVIPSPAQKDVPEEALRLLRADSAIRIVDPMWAMQLPMAPADPAKAALAFRNLPDTVVGTDADAPPFDLVVGRWINLPRDDSSTHSPHEAVISASAAKACQLEIGSILLLGSGHRQQPVQIVGLINTPDVQGWSAAVAKTQMMTPGVGGLFITSALLEQTSGQQRRVSFVGVGLKPGADLTAFRFRWSPKLSSLTTPCQFQEAHDIEEALDESASAENLAFQGHMAAAVSMLAALFIILSTLNMGVTERTRQLAILRAVALTKGQVAALVVIEALLLGTIGFIIGCASGSVLMHVAAASAPHLWEDGAVVGSFSILLAAVCAFGGALLASIWPAIRAMQVRPLDVMGKLAQATTPRVHYKSLCIGLLLMTLYPLLAHVVPHADDEPFVFYMLAGVLTLAAGIVLCSPAVVLLVDRALGPLLAKLLRLPPKLLLSQISSPLDRTVSTAVALTVGLGLLIGIQVWGHSMLSGFMPSSWAPDAMISFQPRGIAWDKAQQLSSWPGVTQSLPIYVEQPRLKRDLTHSAERATVVRQDSVVIVGLDATAALSGDHPLFKFQWVAGDPASAITVMQNQRGCIVPDHFLRETGLQLGDTFELVPPERPEHPVTYTIAGAVKLPGWHWQTKPTGMRTRTHRAAALIFAHHIPVAADFHFQAASYLWLNYDASQTSQSILEQAAQQLLASALNGQQPVVIGDAAPGQPHIQFHGIDKIRDIVRSHSTQWLWVLSRLPIVILLITSVGVLNAMLASVQSRRWDMGILRAVGLTRSVLVRLVIAEGLLIGLVACGLSLCFGILSGWCGAGISQYISFFGGMKAPLTIPWHEILYSLLAVALLSALAAIWPAISIGRAKPLDLLQQGRASF